MSIKEIRSDAWDEVWPYCALLMCGVNYIGSGSQPGTVVIDMVEGECCDMGGAVRVCEALWPGCHEIRTCSGGKADTSYVKRDGTWIALEPINTKKTTP